MEFDKTKQILEDIKKYVKENNVKVHQHDFPFELKIGYQADDGKIWKISIVDIKRLTISKCFSTDEGKKLILDEINNV